MSQAKILLIEDERKSPASWNWSWNTRDAKCMLPKTASPDWI